MGLFYCSVSVQCHLQPLFRFMDFVESFVALIFYQSEIYLWLCQLDWWLWLQSRECIHFKFYVGVKAYFLVCQQLMTFCRGKGNYVILLCLVMLMSTALRELSFAIVNVIWLPHLLNCCSFNILSSC